MIIIRRVLCAISGLFTAKCSIFIVVLRSRNFTSISQRSLLGGELGGAVVESGEDDRLSGLVEEEFEAEEVLEEVGF